jgi:hypothetical protein
MRRSVGPPHENAAAAIGRPANATNAAASQAFQRTVGRPAVRNTAGSLRIAQVIRHVRPFDDRGAARVFRNSSIPQLMSVRSVVGDRRRLRKVCGPQARLRACTSRTASSDTFLHLIYCVPHAGYRVLMHHGTRDLITVEYARHYEDLSALAEELGIPSDEAATLIRDIFYATLIKTPTGDMDRWLAAALRMAWKARTSRPH